MFHVHTVGRPAFAGASRKFEPVTGTDNARASLDEWKPLVDRMGSLWRNHPFVVRALRLYSRHIIGNPTPLFKDASDAQRFLAWYDDAGWGRHHGTFGQIQNIMALAFLCDGDHFLQYLFTSDASHPNGLLLNPIPAFALDTSRGDYGHEIEDGRWMGAYFRDTRISIRSTFVTKFVPSSELVWLRNLQLPNQVRAVPWGHAGMEASAQLGKALNTLVYQLRIAASMMPIMITDQPLQDVEFGDAMVTDASGNVIQKVEPGLIALGHGIKDVKTVTPNLPSSFDAETFLARVGAGLDISLALLTGRFDKTNFSSGKLEVNMLRESTDFVRDITWLPAMRRIWRKLEAAQRLAGDPYVTQPDHVRIPLPVLDPLKEARAEQIRLATNTLSRSELIKARGRDPMRVFEEIKDEQTDLVKDVTALLGGSISVSED